MNYIQQAYKGLYDGWRYILGVLIIFVFWQFFGGFPLIFGLIASLGFDKILKGEMPTDLSEFSTVLGSNMFLFYMLLSFAIGLIGLLIVNKWLHKMTFTQLTTARKRIDWKRFWIIFFCWGIFSSGLVVLDYFLSPESYILNFNLQSFLILSIIAIALVPLQTSFEEYLFRGYLMQGLGITFKNKWAPLIITSVVFGLLHIFNPEVDKLGYVIMVYYIGTGLFLGIMTLMDEGLELALGFHAANNLFTALLVTADWTAFQTHSILRDTSDPTAAGIGDIFVPVFIIYPLILLILSKKYKWTNWKDKLFGPVNEPPKEDYKIIGDDA